MHTKTQILFFAALFLLVPFSLAQIDLPEFEPIEPITEPEYTVPELEPDYTTSEFEPTHEVSELTKTTTTTTPVSKPKVVSTSTSTDDAISTLNSMLSKFEHTSEATSVTEPETETKTEPESTVSDPVESDDDKEDDDDDDEDSEEDSESESESESEESESESEDSEDDSDDESKVTDLTFDLLEGTWYVYNSTAELICCIPSGTVEFYSINATNYIDTDWEGLGCEMSPPSSTFPLSLSDPYIELPQYTKNSEGPTKGENYAYYVSGLSYEHSWPNKTQKVLLSMESISNVMKCSFVLSMSAETIAEKTEY